MIAHHSKSFALASKLLPPDCRDDAAIVYAFCRRADDAVDLAASPEGEKAALALLNHELREVELGYPIDPVLEGYQRMSRTRNVPYLYARELILGMKMDVDGIEYRTLEMLLLYCFRVAGTVGLIMSHVMGVSNPSALRRACHLGMAMQLTNICRDVLEDAERGRIYVPAELINEHGMAGAVKRLLEVAEAYYASGEQGLPMLHWRCALAIRTARHVYAAIGKVIARRGFDIFSGRAVVSGRTKGWLVFKCLLAAAADIPRRMRRTFKPVPLLQAVNPHDFIAL